MTIRVALNHRTTYEYDRPVTLGAQTVRLRPAPHTRTPIASYSLKVDPSDHYRNWQQDPFGNFLARFVFEKPTRRFEVEVDLIADMTIINPFDFFVEPQAEAFPFDYGEGLGKELTPYLERPGDGEAGPRFEDFVGNLPKSMDRTVDFLIELNRRVYERVEYLIRMEPGVQTPEETLENSKGSCRDSAWLLVHMLRRRGIAARFVSGYLIQLKPDVKPAEGPAGAASDFTDLHAWCEAFVPGAGWIGLDPTSGLLTGEGHIPLAATPSPASAAPISGGVSESEVTFDFAMSVSRIHEDPRVTKPYTEDQWRSIDAIGRHVDARLADDDVRLTMGGEPTFVSIDDMEGEEWTVGAVGETKRRMSDELVRRYADRFGTGALLHFGQGKWYPGESLPRWAYAAYWRRDGEPIWSDPELFAGTDPVVDAGTAATPDDARRFAEALAAGLGIDGEHVVAGYEDALYYAWKENRLPPNVSAGDAKADTDEDRRRLAQVFDRGLDTPTGFVLPLKEPAALGGAWVTGSWPVRAEEMFLIPGDSPMGLRLPLDALSRVPDSSVLRGLPIDPLAPREALPAPRFQRSGVADGFSRPPPGVPASRGVQGGIDPGDWGRAPAVVADDPAESFTPPAEIAEIPGQVRTALCVEPRDGRICVFMPPIETLEHYLDLVAIVERVAVDLETRVIVEGYPPPYDPRLEVIKVTPDPGVIEVNAHPARDWNELVGNTRGFYEEAQATRLGAEKFDLDGAHTGTGGGNHIVLGGTSPADSPFLRRPDLLASMIRFWINHPSLSYLFSGKFIGPTSQAPRPDEGRPDALAELEIALRTIDREGERSSPWLVDRVFRHLLTDMSGNTHRSELCIDKLFSPDSSTGRLGLVELRGFEMPPHPSMSLAQQLLIRSIVSHLWRNPIRHRPVRWGTSLHDRFMLPHFLREDLDDVLNELRRGGIDLDNNWFDPHLEFRCPKIGEFGDRSVRVELRSAIEPWYVLGEEPAGGGTSRAVDSSVERVQVLVDGLTESRHAVACNGRLLPLHPTGRASQQVAGVRYRAWQPPRCLHPTIPVHTPLVIDLIDTWQGRSIAGCEYHVFNPTGSNPDRFPVNAFEAESRRAARFFAAGHTPGRVSPPAETVDPNFPMTLDLRRPAVSG